MSNQITCPCLPVSSISRMVTIQYSKVEHSTVRTRRSLSSFLFIDWSQDTGIVCQIPRFQEGFRRLFLSYHRLSSNERTPHQPYPSIPSLELHYPATGNDIMDLNRFTGKRGQAVIIMFGQERFKLRFPFRFLGDGFTCVGRGL